MTGAEKIQHWRRAWQWQKKATPLLVALSIGLGVAMLGKWLWGWSAWGMGLPVLLAAITGGWLASRQKVTIQTVTNTLDQSFPELEDSSSLLVQTGDTNLLQRLQKSKIEGKLQAVEVVSPYGKRLVKAATAFLMVIIGFVLVPRAKPSDKKVVATAPAEKKATLPPQHISNQLQLQPPAYTKLPVKSQQQFAIQAAQGTVAKWQINTRHAVHDMQLQFNDSSSIKLQPTDSTLTNFTASKTLDKSGFYQLQSDGLTSDFYTIDIQPDLAPVVAITSPDAQVNIEPGMPFAVNVKALLKDDYGLQSAHLEATIASGSGEAVKFRNERIDLSGVVRNQKLVSWNHRLDLNTWALKGGDELYFYLEAKDARGQSSRSDICIVRLPDTTELLSMDGLLTAMDVKPEFFRSQRQIIIETEQLIKDKKNLTIEAFNAKSNELGGEQKLLRLRYGKFLGEENETNIGGGHHDHDHDEAGEHKAHNEAGEHEEHGEKKEALEKQAADRQEIADFNNAQKVLGEVSHLHDVAEDATFFDAATKKQLKATLTEMWNAELKLRVYSPEQALPFEYKALRLLKDLQQQSRVYVAKTSVKTTPLDPAKRGTGDQDKIIAPQGKFKQTTANTATEDIAAALVALQNNGDLNAIQKGAGHLSAAAGKKPASLLPKYQALLRVMDRIGKNAAPDPVDKQLAATGLASLLPPATALPAPSIAPNASPLSKAYLDQLTRMTN